MGWEVPYLPPVVWVEQSPQLLGPPLLRPGSWSAGQEGAERQRPTEGPGAAPQGDSRLKDHSQGTKDHPEGTWDHPKWLAT